jgi:hypothetical protein
MTAVTWLEQKMKEFAIDLDLLYCIEQAKAIEKYKMENTLIIMQRIVDYFSDGTSEELEALLNDIDKFIKENEQ